MGLNPELVTNGKAIILARKYVKSSLPKTRLDLDNLIQLFEVSKLSNLFFLLSSYNF